MLLALDTATRQAGIALYDGSTVRAETLWQQAGQHHTEWLAPAVAEALHRLNATAADLTAVAVTRGPGSFTGLRVAISLAKGLVAARGLPLIGIPTLEVVAYPFAALGHICASMPAGRGRYVYAFYETNAENQMQVISEPQLVTLPQLHDDLQSYRATAPRPLWLVGEFAAAERAAVTEGLADTLKLVSPALAVRRPAVLAEVAWQRLQAGQSDDPHTLEPTYLYLPTSGGT